MINSLKAFANKRILLLQGPVGPFFYYLSKDLGRVNSTVFKINFHGGDWLFYPRKAVNYRNTLDEWPSFLESFLKKNRIDLILLFGDCRSLHMVARDVAVKCGVQVGVFEEGYIRPYYITLEITGVNANSRIPKNPDFYGALTTTSSKIQSVNPPFLFSMVWAMVYNVFGSLCRPFFPHYKHHRSLSIFDGVCWLKSFWRKQIYKIAECGFQNFLVTQQDKNFFLIPLQVGSDAQIHSHSKFNNVREFIVEVMDSFAQFAPPETLLVFKQHPLERGYSDHSEFIEAKSKYLNISERIMYIHDQHLPTLLSHARGCVLINSTVGLSAIFHGIIVKNMGEAIYDMPGLTFQGELKDFWTSSEKPDHNLYEKFYNYVINATQINGNFYRRIPTKDFQSGVLWE
jgi:capsular polysaccharide export protein